MKAKMAIMALLLSAVFFIIIAMNRRATSSDAPSAAAQAARDGAGATPVLVELFTSEGCSSCPPADQVLTRLQQGQPVPGAEVIALSEHVDYWNRLGWTDPFSSAAFSSRQSVYSDVFRKDGVYTPQMVVDGQSEFVGSDFGRATEVIAKAAQTPKASVSIKLAPNADHGKDAPIRLAVAIQNAAKVAKGDAAEVWLAITEDDLQSSVARGENSGRKLIHNGVVRKLSSLGALKSTDGSFNAEPAVRIEGGWKLDRLRAVVFVQARNSRAVLGAGTAALSGASAGAPPVQ